MKNVVLNGFEINVDRLKDVWRSDDVSVLSGILRSYREKVPLRNDVSEREFKRLNDAFESGEWSNNDVALLLSVLNGLPYRFISDVINDYITLLKHITASGGEVTITGFGKFDVKEFEFTDRETPIGVVRGRVKRLRFKQSRAMKRFLNGGDK